MRNSLQHQQQAKISVHGDSSDSVLRLLGRASNVENASSFACSVSPQGANVMKTASGVRSNPIGTLDHTPFPRNPATRFQNLKLCRTRRFTRFTQLRQNPVESRLRLHSGFAHNFRIAAKKSNPDRRHASHRNAAHEYACSQESDTARRTVGTR